MDVTISGRNVDINEDVKDAVRSKIGSLDRFVPGLDRAAVVFREEKNPRIAEREQLEATLEGHGHHIRCKVSGVDQMQAVDLAVVKLEKQLRKLKTRVVKRHRPNSHRNDNHRPLSKSAVVEQEPLEEDLPEEIPAAELVVPEIAKRKSFELMDMTPVAAATRM